MSASSLPRNHTLSGNMRLVTPQLRSACFSTAGPEQHLTHIDKQGRPAMVDVSHKEITGRTATAQGRIFIPKIAYDLICNYNEAACDADVDADADAELKRRRDKTRAKGDVLSVAQLAGIMASKKTSDLIPLCHPILVSHISVELLVEEHSSSNAQIGSTRQYNILCRATAACDGKTGVEMEALTAVSVSLLTVWDMLKAVAGKEMLIDGLYVTNKSGGKSGDFDRKLVGMPSD